MCWVAKEYNQRSQQADVGCSSMFRIYYGTFHQSNVCWDWQMAQVFATSHRRMRSAIWLAFASGTLVEYFPSRRTQYRRPAGCRISSIRYVFPPRFFKLIRMSAGSLGTLLTLRVLQVVPE